MGATELRAAGFDVATVVEQGLVSRSDHTMLEVCRATASGLAPGFAQKCPRAWVQRDDALRARARVLAVRLGRDEEGIYRTLKNLHALEDALTLLDAGEPRAGGRDSD